MALLTDDRRRTLSVSFTTSSSDLTAAVDLRGDRLAAIVMPSASTDWTAANLTFQGSQDASTYINIYDQSGNELQVVAAGARSIVLDATFALALGSHRYIKVRSGTAAAGVSQTTERTLTLVVMPA